MLGAVVSPTDPIAATAIGRRLGVPRRLIDIIEGESLVNDGTALVLLRTAIVAAVAGHVLAVGRRPGGSCSTSSAGSRSASRSATSIRRVRRALDNPPLEVTIAFLTGYFAFLPASALGVSGVLAVVTAGVYIGWYTPELTTVQTRLQGQGFWEILTFLLNVLLFGLVGLQLRPILDSLSGHERLVARRRRGRDRARGDRRPDRLGLPRRPTCRAGSSRASASATRSRRGRTRRSSRGTGCAAP